MVEKGRRGSLKMGFVELRAEFLQPFDGTKFSLLPVLMNIAIFYA
jgi:Zn-dependent protease